MYLTNVLVNMHISSLLWILFLSIFLTVIAKPDTEDNAVNGSDTVSQEKTNVENGRETRELTEKDCLAPEPKTPNFLSPGLRISEAKCAEYNWILQRMEREEEIMLKCRGYRVKNINKETSPQLFYLSDGPIIYGGRPAEVTEFPHMGAVGWKSNDPAKPWVFKCGSTLISENFILTAGHCTRLSLRLANDISDPVPKVVRFGVENIDEDLSNLYGEPIDVNIKRIIAHPQFAPPKRYYDIALMKLENNVQFEFRVIPACLWKDHDTNPLGNQVSLTGWGYTEKGFLSDVLQVAYVDILDTTVCDNLLFEKRNRHWQGFSSHQICAGNLSGGVDTCQGDSGGPIQIKLDPKGTKRSLYMVVGVTSFGIKCARSNTPGIYTRVSTFIDWIEENVWGDVSNSTHRSIENRNR